MVQDELDRLQSSTGVGGHVFVLLAVLFSWRTSPCWRSTRPAARTTTRPSLRPKMGRRSWSTPWRVVYASPTSTCWHSRIYLGPFDDVHYFVVGKINEFLHSIYIQLELEAWIVVGHWLRHEPAVQASHKDIMCAVKSGLGASAAQPCIEDMQQQLAPTIVLLLLQLYFTASTTPFRGSCASPMASGGRLYHSGGGYLIGDYHLSELVAMPEM